MQATEGMVRGMKAISLGGPISVPVGYKKIPRLIKILTVLRKLAKQFLLELILEFFYQKTWLKVGILLVLDSPTKLHNLQ